MDSTEIKKLRKSLKMSQREFGIKISETLKLEKPIFGENVYRWESGRCKPHPTFMNALEQIKQEKDSRKIATDKK